MMNSLRLVCVIIFMMFVITGIAMAVEFLPDTGQTKCYDAKGEELFPCPEPGEVFYGQDANYTRERSYTKLDQNGNDLPDLATIWYQVRDNVTGLVWEVKTNDGALHDRGNEYDWSNAQNLFVAALNSGSGYCGYNDWRLPTVKELSSLTDLSRNLPAIDITYFPHTVASSYWSSTTIYDATRTAFRVDFSSGNVDGSGKRLDKYVRAVRSGQSQPLVAFIDNADGTITDPNTGLMWQQDDPGAMVWQNALAYCEDLVLPVGGYDDWRLPDRHELQSLVDYSRYKPLLDTIFFPEVLSSNYWSSTTVGAAGAWLVHFGYGRDYSHSKADRFNVRAVRSGQLGPSGDLTTLTINGAITVNQNSSEAYIAKANWSDGTTIRVPAIWNEDSDYTTISSSGILTSSSVTSNQPVTITASYTSGGVKRSDTHEIRIIDTLNFLTGLTIKGATNVTESSSLTYYTATASWSDGTTNTVTPTWNEDSDYATISPSGLLMISSMPSDQSVTITASYTSGDVTKTDTHSVAILYTTMLAGLNLPDTGQTKFYNNTIEIIPTAPGEKFYGQDAQYVRARSYTKLDIVGNDLSDAAAEWFMVRDNVTGLIWEVKHSKDNTKDYNDPNDADNTYTWYDSNPANNGGDVGTPGSGTDTEDYINALNENNYGSHDDWRLPTVVELSRLTDSGEFNYSISSVYFPQVLSSHYWTSTTFAINTNSAWLVYFYDGSVIYGGKTYSSYVRAVRSGPSQLLEPLIINQNNPDTLDDDTVTDPNTGLMWQRFESERMEWETALEYCEDLTLAGHDDWRLPDHHELQSLVDYSRYGPSIDDAVVPEALTSSWSSTTCANRTNLACYVSLQNGNVGYSYKSNDKCARAVRSEQSGPLDPNDIDNDCDDYTENQGDCNDNDPLINPGVVEICGDSRDNNCNGVIDEGCPVDYTLGPYNYYLPFFKSGDNFWTGLGLANHNHAIPNDLRVIVYDSTGHSLAHEYKTIPPYGQDAFSVAPQLDNTGWMEVNTHQELYGLAFLGGGAAPLLMADIPFTSELSTCLVVPHIAQDDYWNTEILICNPNSENVSVSLIYVDKVGTIQGTKNYYILPHGSGVYLLSEVFSKKLPLAGMVEINSSNGIAAFALYSDKKNGGTYYAGINAESCE